MRAMVRAFHLGFHRIEAAQLLANIHNVIDVCKPFVLTIVIAIIYTQSTRCSYLVGMDQNPVDKEIRRIDAWLADTGMKESRLGLLACANPRAIERIRNGSGSIDTLRAVIDYIKRNPASQAGG